MGVRVERPTRRAGSLRGEEPVRGGEGSSLVSCGIPGSNGRWRLRLLFLLVPLVLLPTEAQATGGPASALSGLQSPLVMLAAGLFLLFAAISCWYFYRLTRDLRKKWWLLSLMLLGSALAAVIGAAALFFPLLYLLFWLET